MADFEVDVFISDASATVTGTVTGEISLDVDLESVTSNNNLVTEVSAVEIDLPVSLTAQQGPPGVQNLYVQGTNPAVQYGWGPEEAGFIWVNASI
ncbi:MAG TPA: hypothetical protein VIY48_18090 [Candidatus Paceibacterota bacterium]